MKDKCLHKNIKIVTVAHYKVDISWKELQEKDDIDMQNYYIETERDKVVCKDCAETLDE